MLKAILVDDELHCLETLTILLKEYCPQVEITASCRSAREGLKAIEKSNPDILFLDIEMPSMNGFQLLEQLREIPFSVIFTTSYDQYAIKAIRFSALDYLLKPIDQTELVAAIFKLQKQSYLPLAEQFRMLLNKIQRNENRFSKIAIPTAEGFELISADQLIRCEADDNYTHFFLKNKTRLTACRTLKEIEEQLLEFSSFIRVHHSHLVNLNEVTKYVKGEGGYLTMTDGSSVNVSRSRKIELLKLF